jgi:membrane-associated phospholipid phosphatase
MKNKNVGNEKPAIMMLYLKRIIIVSLIYLIHSFLYDWVSVNHLKTNYNLLTDLDKTFPFIPEMVYLYVSLYAVIILSIFLIKNEEAFAKIIMSMAGTLLLTYPLFYFVPANYPVPSFEVNNFTNWFLKWCFEADVPNNTFPSLHVSLSFMLAFGIRHYNKKLGLVYIIWAIGIALSTIMIRKHFIIDSFSGIIMASFNYSLFISGGISNIIFSNIQKIKNYLTLLMGNKLRVNINHNIIYLLANILKMK